MWHPHSCCDMDLLHLTDAGSTLNARYTKGYAMCIEHWILTHALCSWLSEYFCRLHQEVVARKPWVHTHLTSRSCRYLTANISHWTLHPLHCWLHTSHYTVNILLWCSWHRCNRKMLRETHGNTQTIMLMQICSQLSNPAVIQLSLTVSALPVLPYHGYYLPFKTSLIIIQYTPTLCAGTRQGFKLSLNWNLYNYKKKSSCSNIYIRAIMVLTFGKNILSQLTPITETGQQSKIMMCWSFPCLPDPMNH